MRMRILTAALVCVLIIGLLPQTAQAYTSDASAYRYGTVDVLSTASEKPMTDSFYYRDDWFQADPAKRNDALALASMQFVAAATDGSEHGAGAAFLKDLGFEEFGFSGFTSTDPDDCAYTWGRKTINVNGTPCTLVAVAIQSYSLDKDITRKGWTQNFTVNGLETSGEHEAFRQAAEKALPDIADLGAGQGVGPNVKFWITGHSRGGAIASLIAAKLPGYLDARGTSVQGIYAYTFEAPAPAEAAGVLASYDYIHNYLCSDDIVSMVPPWDMGRFGKTYKLKTEKTDARLQAELEKLGSSLAGKDVITDGVKQREIIDTMVETIPTREDYSRTQTDFQGSTYTYQEAFCALMGVIFGDGIRGLSINTMVNNKNVNRFLMIAEAMAQGAKASAEGRTPEAENAYRQAAADFTSTAEDIGITMDLTESDIYALMKVMSPMVIDYDYQPSGEEPIMSLINYVAPGISLFRQKDSLIASHHFDTVIARLKTLAPEPCDQAVSGLTSEKDPKKSAVLPLELKSTKQETNNVTLKWKAMKGAASYAVYGAQCGKKQEMVRLARTEDASFTAKKVGANTKLKSGEYYRFIVVALDGEGRVLSVSKMIHAATAGSSKAANPKAVKIRVKTGKKYKVKKKASLKKGGSIRIQGVIVKPSKNASVKKHVGIRYASTDPAVASVSAKGVVKGKAKGSCRIVAYAQNGAAQSLRITVK